MATVTDFDVAQGYAGDSKVSMPRVDTASTFAHAEEDSPAVASPAYSEDELSNSSMPLSLPKKPKVALMKYQFGKYDYDGVNESWQIPVFEKYDVKGFFFANKGLLRQEDVLAMKEKGWEAVEIDLAPGTQYVTSERVTTKITKWGVPKQLRDYDFVVTHDCDLDTTYTECIPFMVGEMEKNGTAALFQQHERNLSCTQEIDLFLNEKGWRVSTSREKCIEWKAKMEEVVKSGKHDLSGKEYLKCNCFAFRPNDPAFLKFGEVVVDKCHEIQRDQFIVVWAIKEYGVNYTKVTEAELSKHGVHKPQELRDARTGVWN